MPPAIAAVISVAASIGIKALAISALAKALLTIAVTLAISLLAKKPTSNKLNQGQELRTKFDPTMTRQVLTGYTATGGSCHFTWTTTNDAKKPNRYLYRVIQLSDQPIHSLVKVMEGTTELSWSGDLTTGWRTCTQHRDKSGNAKLWMRVYKGAMSATADATLISETGGAWTSSHKGTGLAYAIVKLDYDDEAFSGGEPEFTWVVEGAHLYDDRKDSTKPGGSGAHRLNNYSTWEFSENSALITAQFLRGFYLNGILIAGVQAEERDLSTSMLFSAYNTCDSTVTESTGTEPRYRSAMIINSNEAASDILVDLQASMDGKIFDRGGAITILPGANRTPVMNLNDEDIIWTAEKSWQPKASLERMLNHITSNFIDSGQNFQERNLPVLSNPTWEADDGGERFTEFYSFRAVNRWAQGQRITKRLHQYTRYTGTAAFVGPIWLLELEQGDWLTLTSPRWGFTTKYFEIQECSITADAQIALVCREVNPDSDLWDHSVDEKPRDDSSWTPPSYDLPEPAIVAEAITVTDPVSGLGSFGLKAALVDDPALYGVIVKLMQYQYTWDDMSIIVDGGTFPISHSALLVTGLAPATEYFVRARFGDGGRWGDWCDWESTLMDNAAAAAAGYGFALTNPSENVVANSDGSLGGGALTNAGGQFLILAGGAVSTGWTFTVQSEVGVDASIDSSTGIYTINSFTSIGTLRGDVVFRASNGTLTIDLKYDITKSVAGQDADPVYGVTLSNEDHTITTDADGNNGNFTNAFGSVIVSDGTGNVVSTGAVTIGSATASGCTGTVNTANNTPVSGQSKGYYRVTAISSDSAYLDIPITVGGTVYTKRFSVRRGKSGATLRLWPNKDSIAYNGDGVATPTTQTTTITCIPVGTDDTGLTWQVATLTGSFYTPGLGVITTISNRVRELTRSQFEGIAGSTQGCRVKVSKTVNGETLEDTVTIMKSQMGASAKGLNIYPSQVGISYDGNGSPDPATQTVTYVAQKINTTQTVNWSVKDLAGTPKTPVTSYLSAATGDTVTQNISQFNSARGSTNGVIIQATLTDGTVVLTETLTQIKVASGAAAIGYVQDSPVPTATFINQTWYRPTTKEWYRAAGTGCSTISGGCWVRILGNLSGLDEVDTGQIADGAINYAGWVKQGTTIILSSGGAGETFETTSVTANIPIEGTRQIQKFDFIYEVSKVNPTAGDEYKFTVRGLVARVSSGLITYSDSAAVEISERWAWASDTGTKSFGKKVGHMEFVYSTLVSGQNYTVGYRIVVPAGFTLTLYPYRYINLEDQRALNLT